VLGLKPYFSIAFALSAVTTTATLAYEFQRRILFLQRKSLTVVLCALTYFLLAGVGVAIVMFWLRNVTAAAMGLFIAALAAAIVGWSRRDPLPGPSVRIHDHLGIVGWNLLSFLPYAVYNNGMLLIVGAVSDARAVALFTASRLFTAPVQTLLQAIDSVDKPRARRMFASDGSVGLSRSLNGTRRSLLALGLPYLVLIAAGAGFIVPTLFGTRFPGMVEAVRAWSIVALLMLLSQPLETGLLVLHKSDLFFWTRSAAAIATVVTLLGVGVLIPPLAPIAALVVGWGAGGILAGLLLKRQLQKAVAR
jgi:O-antigen/teichoic acid export membrane protein